MEIDHTAVLVSELVAARKRVLGRCDIRLHPSELFRLQKSPDVHFRAENGTLDNSSHEGYELRAIVTLENGKIYVYVNPHVG